MSDRRTVLTLLGLAGAGAGIGAVVLSERDDLAVDLPSQAAQATRTATEPDGAPDDIERQAESLRTEISRTYEQRAPETPAFAFDYGSVEATVDDAYFQTIVAETVAETPVSPDVTDGDWLRLSSDKVPASETEAVVRAIWSLEIVATTRTVVDGQSVTFSGGPSHRFPFSAFTGVATSSGRSDVLVARARSTDGARTLVESLGELID